MIIVENEGWRRVIDARRVTRGSFTLVIGPDEVSVIGL